MTNNATLYNEPRFSNQTNRQFWTEPSWVCAVAINGLLIIINLWVLACLIHYGQKKKKWRKDYQRSAEKLSAGSVYSSTVACAATALLRLLISQIVFNFGIENPKICEVLFDLLFVVYSMVVFTTYLFLWFRQRIFYTNRMLNVNYNKKIKFLSAASFIILAVAGVAVVLLNCIPRSYTSTRQSCVSKADDLPLDLPAWITIALMLITGQVMLVALFTYALYQSTQFAQSGTGLDCLKCCSSATDSQAHSKSLQENSYAASTSINKESFQITTVETDCQLKCSNNNLASSMQQRISNTPSQLMVKQIIRRTILFGVISLTIDLILLALLSTSILDTTIPETRRLSVVLYDLNAFLNLMLVVFSFAKYKEMLTSFCKK